MKRMWRTDRLTFWRLGLEDRNRFEEATEQVGNRWMSTVYDEWAATDPGGLYVATLGDEIIASVHLTFERPGEAWAQGAHIGPAWQGQGFLNDVKQFVIWECRRLGAACLGVWTSLPQCVRIFLKYGYEQKGDWLKGGKLAACAPIEPEVVRHLAASDIERTMQFIKMHPDYQKTGGWIPSPANHMVFHSLQMDDLEAIARQELLLGAFRDGQLRGVGLASRIRHWETGEEQLVVLQVFTSPDTYLPLVTSLLALGAGTRAPNYFSLHPGDELFEQLDAHLTRAGGQPRWSTIGFYINQLS